MSYPPPPPPTSNRLRQFFCRIPYRPFQNTIVNMPTLSSIPAIPRETLQGRVAQEHNETTHLTEQTEMADARLVEDLLLPTIDDTTTSSIPDGPHHPIITGRDAANDRDERAVVRELRIVDRTGPRNDRRPSPLKGLRHSGSGTLPERVLRKRAAILTERPFSQLKSKKISGKTRHTRWYALASHGPLLSPPHPTPELELEEMDLFVHIDTSTVPDYSTYEDVDYERFITIWKWVGEDGEGKWEVVNVGYSRMISGAHYVLALNRSLEPGWVLPRSSR
ncbi:hypothetical protein PQX77_011719 [Marasmius sp. AFHP31]|nr:hypothetical protein PQX77_011719 [Marasmius sp. AFHP31]